MVLLNRKVSVIMPVKNGEKHILDSVMSVLDQKYTNTELIVIDDCSTDRTMEILDSVLDNRLIVIRNTTGENGVSSARNLGLKSATGQLIAFCDSDDLWSVEHLTDALRHLNDGVVFYSCNVNVIDYKGDLRFKRNFIPELILNRYFRFLFYQIDIVSVVLDRNIIKNALFDTRLKIGEDWLFFYNITSNLSRQRIAYNTKPNVSWRLHDSSSTGIVDWQLINDYREFVRAIPTKRVRWRYWLTLNLYILKNVFSRRRF